MLFDFSRKSNHISLKLDFMGNKTGLANKMVCNQTGEIGFILENLYAKLRNSTEKLLGKYWYSEFGDVQKLWHMFGHHNMRTRTQQCKVHEVIRHYHI